jgi:hypothetical protein
MNPSNEHREREGKLGQKYTTFFNLCRMMSYERDLNMLLDFLVTKPAEVQEYRK